MAVLADIMEEAGRIDDKKMRGDYIRHEVRNLEAAAKLLRLALEEYEGSRDPDDLTQKEIDLIVQRKHIQAIKEVRSRTKTGLAEAKRSCDLSNNSCKPNSPV